MFLQEVKPCLSIDMRFDPDQLETLLVITEEGTFEGAARRLHVTPSAVSQRVRALERTAGQVLVRRTSPAAVTPAGEPLLKLSRQLRLLAAEAAAAVDGDGVTELAVAVNADSLATWFRPVLRAVAGRPATSLRLHVVDQAYSHELLQRGEVLAAVTDDPQPVQGCTADPLGALRYTPAACPALVERYRRGRGVDWSAMPVVVYDERDHLQDRALADHGVTTRPAVVHRVPSTADHHEAVRSGLGWAMVLEPFLQGDLAQGSLTVLPGARPVDVPLFWQRWRLDSGALAVLTDDVREAAAGLRGSRTRR